MVARAQITTDMLLHYPFLCQAISFLRSGQNPHPHSNFRENLPNPTRKTTMVMMPSLDVRVWASQCSGHAQNPARSNTPAGISAIFRKKLRIVHATIKKDSI
jgi:hypothetical protein